VLEKLELGPNDRVAVFVPGVLSENICCQIKAALEEAWKLPHRVAVFEDGIKLQVLEDGGNHDS
jgi:hypothetical protein